MRGRTFVYFRRKLQNAHCSTTRALPLLVVLAALDDRLGGRLRAVVALRALREAADPFRVPQREMMRTGPALPHIVINAADPLLCLLPLLEQRVVLRLSEADHARLTRRAPAAPVSAPLPKADDRAQANRDRAQQTINSVPMPGEPLS